MRALAHPGKEIALDMRLTLPSGRSALGQTQFLLEHVFIETHGAVPRLTVVFARTCDTCTRIRTRE